MNRKEGMGMYHVIFMGYIPLFLTLIYFSPSVWVVSIRSLRFLRWALALGTLAICLLSILTIGESSRILMNGVYMEFLLVTLFYVHPKFDAFPVFLIMGDIERGWAVMGRGAGLERRERAGGIWRVDIRMFFSFCYQDFLFPI